MQTSSPSSSRHVGMVFAVGSAVSNAQSSKLAEAALFFELNNTDGVWGFTPPSTASNLAPNALAEGVTRALVVNVAWRALLGPSTTLRQQTSVMRHRFLNREQGGRLSNGGGNEEIAYRADMVQTFATSGTGSVKVHRRRERRRWYSYRSRKSFLWRIRRAAVSSDEVSA